MSILVDDKSVVLVQGITGKQGVQTTKDMLAYGTRVVAGVTPGKGGQSVEGVSVHNTVSEALQAYPDINVAMVSVPPTFAKDAIFEAILAGISTITVLSEGIPIRDTAEILAQARVRDITIIGPASIGVISPGKAKVGVIFGSNPDDIAQKGDIGVISKSGGMTAELALILKNAGLGVSTALSIGGDMITCTDFADVLRLFETDAETRAVAMYGELGGTYEEQAAQAIKRGEFTKPLVAFIAGKFAETYLPQGHQLGHAGAIVESGKGTVESKQQALTDAGAIVVDAPYDIPKFIQ